jgi:tRNA G10  N-methylase Trm11
MYIALLGRQPALSIAELERRFTRVSWASPTAALIDREHPIDIQTLGGTQKLGRVIFSIPARDWRGVSMKIVSHYQKAWANETRKITLGISAYGFDTSVRDIQKTGLIMKQKLKASGASMRLVPQQDPVLSTAVSHHNKLGLSDTKVELLVVRGPSHVYVAESTGAQNITALAARDQGRPRRDAFVGMLPPKLALLMLNLAGPLPATARVLDPFCGTGVVLQESLLRGYRAYGTDLSEKMIQYTNDNLNWLTPQLHDAPDWNTAVGDAIDTQWQSPIDAVVAESYLGQPFSAPPSDKKLVEVCGNCQHIISGFLKNLASQLAPGTPVVLAVPAWKRTDETFVHLPLVADVERYGFERVNLKTARPEQLLYARPDQVVGREILVLRTKA